MKELINKWYRNHALIYKLLLFLATTLFIVYLFPKTGKFKYSFEKGKPWQSENLYAPFDFAIKKTDQELNLEKAQITQSSEIYFNIDSEIKNEVLDNYLETFNIVFKDSVSVLNERFSLFEKGQNAINEYYKYGILNSVYAYDSERTVILIENNIQKEKIQFKDLYKQSEIRSSIENILNDGSLYIYKDDFVSLFFDIIKPNITINKSLTDNLLEEELSKISPTRGSIINGTLIISKGQVVEDEQFNILSSLKTEYESQVWNTANYNWVLFAYTLLVALTLLMLLLFLKKYRLDVFSNNTKVTFIFFNIVVMIVLTTLVINYNSQYLYVVPLCILPLVLKAFFDARLGLFAHVLTVLLLGFIVPNSYEYMFLQIIAGIVTILTVSELYKRANLFISVGQITLIYIIAYFAFFVIHEGQITTLKLDTFGLFVLCGLATLFVQPLIYIYEKIFGLVSDVSLLELSDTNTKLLKELSNKAPGTFHHSLNVANLAEASANEIGANAMLVRVGALYHDIGKMKNPTYFTENQSTGINPHEELSSKESSDIIINHVLDGIEIAKKNNLPDRVIDFIRTHHGTSVVYYFYMKEKTLDDKTMVSDFSYPGPKPFSKETAILMMCDSVEAASKSLKAPTSSKINDFVENIINKQMDMGQFLNADITFKEIQAIKKVLKLKLANIYHLRIEYPE
ncbi:HD family phosphohydrolase [Winogradskyella immobilis]|uniref:HDIG domain-containing protein n=1 Tax=Winogradskyella immobilis TaxID=2816852 RepID=A0ABS8EQH7_9FLAO|nr:HDIG domain-containing metalloprotein [Winogradskyella immobilis]MCC1484557.1 HDIG domain-containing protein [Winogradskyella immobilis]MCG0016649.1 HDIG domain-containing protein [Winogradskyella immobilis]